MTNQSQTKTFADLTTYFNSQTDSSKTYNVMQGSNVVGQAVFTSFSNTNITISSDTITIAMGSSKNPTKVTLENFEFSIQTANTGLGYAQLNLSYTSNEIEYSWSLPLVPSTLNTSSEFGGTSPILLPFYGVTATPGSSEIDIVTFAYYIVAGIPNSFSLQLSSS